MVKGEFILVNSVTQPKVALCKQCDWGRIVTITMDAADKNPSPAYILGLPLELLTIIALLVHPDYLYAFQCVCRITYTATRHAIVVRHADKSAEALRAVSASLSNLADLVVGSPLQSPRSWVGYEWYDKMVHRRQANTHALVHAVYISMATRRMSTLSPYDTDRVLLMNLYTDVVKRIGSCEDELSVFIAETMTKTLIRAGLSVSDVKSYWIKCIDHSGSDSEKAARPTLTRRALYSDVATYNVMLKKKNQIDPEKQHCFNFEYDKDALKYLHSGLATVYVDAYMDTHRSAFSPLKTHEVEPTFKALKGSGFGWYREDLHRYSLCEKAVMCGNIPLIKAAVTLIRDLWTWVKFEYYVNLACNNASGVWSVLVHLLLDNFRASIAYTQKTSRYKLPWTFTATCSDAENEDRYAAYELLAIEPATCNDVFYSLFSRGCFSIAVNLEKRGCTVPWEIIFVDSNSEWQVTVDEYVYAFTRLGCNANPLVYYKAMVYFYGHATIEDMEMVYAAWKKHTCNTPFPWEYDACGIPIRVDKYPPPIYDSDYTGKKMWVCENIKAEQG